MAIENLKMHMIWVLLIFNIAFWLYIAINKSLIESHYYSYYSFLDSTL
jgi:hypothetical protein